MTSDGFGQEVATCILPPKKQVWFGLGMEVLARFWFSLCLQRSNWEWRGERTGAGVALTSLHLKSL